MRYGCPLPFERETGIRRLHLEVEAFSDLISVPHILVDRRCEEVRYTVASTVKTRPFRLLEGYVHVLDVILGRDDIPMSFEERDIRRTSADIDNQHAEAWLARQVAQGAACERWRPEVLPLVSIAEVVIEVLPNRVRCDGNGLTADEFDGELPLNLVILLK